MGEEIGSGNRIQSRTGFAVLKTEN